MPGKLLQTISHEEHIGGGGSMTDGAEQSQSEITSLSAANPAGPVAPSQSVGTELANFHGTPAPAAPLGPVTSIGHMGGQAFNYHGDEPKGNEVYGVVAPEPDHEMVKGHGYVDNEGKPAAVNATQLDAERAKYEANPTKMFSNGPVDKTMATGAARLKGFDAMHPKGDYGLLLGHGNGNAMPVFSAPITGDTAALGDDHLRNQLNADYQSSQAGGTKSVVGDASAGVPTDAQMAYEQSDSNKPATAPSSVPSVNTTTLPTAVPGKRKR